MTGFRVTWIIDIGAETPMEAAQKARDIQLDPTSIATFFQVEAGDSLMVVELAPEDDDV